MSGDQDFARQYGMQLRAYLDDPSEEMLMSAYDLGRAALEGSAGLVGLVATHSEALRGIVGDNSDAGPVALAARFITQCLAPLEMAYRGFMEANRSLQALNADLEARVRERTRELGETNAELKAFTYSVSHDLRAPLRAINAYSQILTKDAGPLLDEECRRALERLNVNALRMNQMVDDMLRLSRLARQELTRQHTDLSVLATEVVNELLEQQPDRDVAVRIEPGMEAEVDPGLLRIALTNLLGNALKFTRDQPVPRVTFGREAGEGEPVYVVSDNGPGFDPGEAERLFLPFRRLPSAESYPGTGIGLATVRRVMLKHGGRVWAEASPGLGARFAFTLGEASARGR